MPVCAEGEARKRIPSVGEPREIEAPTCLLLAATLELDASAMY